MDLKLFQVDAFADKPFTGNPAAVMPLEAWLPDKQMQGIALENNLAETAFFVKSAGKGADHYDLRWFTPTVEVDLCGHATLASAYVLFRWLSPQAPKVTFHTKSGPLTVARAGDDLLAMDLPSRPPQGPASAHFAEELARTLKTKPKEVLGGLYPMAILDGEESVRAVDGGSALAAMLKRFHEDCLIVTAHADGAKGYEVVSRFFAPGKGVPEDPVTGSAHCQIVPYWARSFRKKEIACFQASPRGGLIEASDKGGHVTLKGRCHPFLVGTVLL